MDGNHLNDSRGKILALLRDKRYPKPTESELNDREEHIRAALAELGMIGYSGLNKDDLTKLRPTDDYETELNVMAETQAYLQVAYKVSLLKYVDLTIKRTIDSAPRIIDAEYIVPVARGIYRALVTQLSIFTPDGAARSRAFLAESPLHARQREHLTQRRERLGQTKDSIKRFGTR